MIKVSRYGSILMLKKSIKHTIKWVQRRSLGRGLQARMSSFKKLLPKNAKIRRVATGFQFTEGPVWIIEEECLLFTDIPAHQILKLNRNHEVTIFREPSGNSNGLT